MAQPVHDGMAGAAIPHRHDSDQPRVRPISPHGTCRFGEP
jgi:hypothetical protein